MSRATTLLSKLKEDMKRCTRLNYDDASASLSNAVVSFSNVTVCTLQRAHTNRDINFIRAKFIVPPNWVTRIEFNSLLLDIMLVFRYLY